MDPTTFDAFTKALATPSSRRRALKGFVGAAVGGALGLGGIKKISSLAAGRKIANSVTLVNQNSSGSTNTNRATSDPLAGATGGNASAQTGPITITEPLPQAGGSVPSGSVSCPPSQVCGAVCCPSGQVCCSGTCVNLQTDPNNCGTCGNSCNGTTPGRCQNGGCVCFGLEQPCTNPSQCCDTGQGVTTCGVVICCNNAGGQCIDDPDCCGTLHCTLGFCA